MDIIVNPIYPYAYSSIRLSLELIHFIRIRMQYKKSKPNNNCNNNNNALIHLRFMPSLLL